MLDLHLVPLCLAHQLLVGPLQPPDGVGALVVFVLRPAQLRLELVHPGPQLAHLLLEGLGLALAVLQLLQLLRVRLAQATVLKTETQK